MWWWLSTPTRSGLENTQGKKQKEQKKWATGDVLQEGDMKCRVHLKGGWLSPLVTRIIVLTWWYPEDRLAEAPVALQKTCQTQEVNDTQSQSDTMSVGRPWNQNTCRTSISPVSPAEGRLGSGIKWSILENRSTTIKISVPVGSGDSGNSQWIDVTRDA